MHYHNAAKHCRNPSPDLPPAHKKLRLRAELSLIHTSNCHHSEPPSPQRTGCRDWDVRSLPGALQRSLFRIDGLGTRGSAWVQLKTWVLSVLACDLYCDAPIVPSVLEIKGKRSLKILEQKKMSFNNLVSPLHFKGSVTSLKEPHVFRDNAT